MFPVRYELNLYILFRRNLLVFKSRVEAVSNTSTVALRFVGGDEKERSLESDAVGLGPENDCAGEGQQQL
jgi:hypothetical protein